MTSFVVLTPPGGPDRDHASTCFVADRFAWLGFVFPGLWLLFHRCWLIGLAVLAAQLAAAWLTDQSGFFWAGTFSELALGLLIGLEGRQIVMRNLMAKGWTMVDVVAAPDLSTAEMMYFSNLPTETPKPAVPVTDWKNLSPPAQTTSRHGPALGLFDIGGGR
nr:DUF2628 domain-containing protein [Rhizobium sp. CSW-27]